MAQYVAGKGIITKATSVSSESYGSSGSSSGSSTGSSTSGGGSSGSGTGGNTGGSDDKYEVYEKSNKDTFETNENVKTIANKTTEDKETLKNLADAFSFSQTKGNKGTNLLFTANSIVLYDADGNKDTKNDQIVLDGKIGLENVNPEFGIEYDITKDILPKQIKAVVNYDQVMGLTVTGQESVSMADFMSKIRKAMSMPENKFDYFIAELQGIDWDNTVVLASVGVNLGLNQVQIGMRDIQNATAWDPLNTMIVFMVLMDFEGNISVKTVLDAEYRDVTKTGINIQQQNFNGGYGTIDENKGDYNTTVSIAGTEYAVNIYNQHDTTLSLSMSTEGKAYMDTGVGIGAGIMCMGIMPAMVKGTIGLEGSLEGGGEASWNNKDGMKWQVEGAAKLRGYLKAKALIKLKAKYWWFGDQEKTLEKEFDLADITLMEESWSGQEQSKPKLSYDASWEKYLDYTEEQLKEAKEFKSCSYVFPIAGSSDWRYVYTYYYDGDGKLELDNGRWPAYDELNCADNIVIGTSKMEQWNSNSQQWIEAGEGWMVTNVFVRAQSAIKGITSQTTAGDLNSIGKWLINDPTQEYIPTFEFWPREDSKIVLEASILEYVDDEDVILPSCILKDLDINKIQDIILQMYADRWEEFSEIMTDYCKDKIINPDAFLQIFDDSVLDW